MYYFDALNEIPLHTQYLEVGASSTGLQKSKFIVFFPRNSPSLKFMLQPLALNMNLMLSEPRVYNQYIKPSQGIS